MNCFIKNYICSSIGKKQLMAVTGLLLTLFCITHLLGNFLLIVGEDAFNKYCYTLTSNPLIYVAEAGLLALFLGHIALAAMVTIENKKARPTPYYSFEKSGMGATLASRSMALTGLLILVFLITHLINFRFGHVYPIEVDGKQMRDMYRTVMELFQNKLYAFFYVLSALLLGLHLSHGISSVFQTFGVSHSKYNKTIKCAGQFVALVIALGFSSIVVWANCKGY